MSLSVQMSSHLPSASRCIRQQISCWLNYYHPILLINHFCSIQTASISNSVPHLLLTRFSSTDTGRQPLFRYPDYLGHRWHHEHCALCRPGKNRKVQSIVHHFHSWLISWQTKNRDCIVRLLEKDKATSMNSRALATLLIWIWCTHGLLLCVHLTMSMTRY